MKKKTTLSEEDQALFRQLMAGTRKIKQDTIVHRPQRKKISEVPVKRLIQEQADASHYFSDEFQPLLNTEGPVKYVRPDVSHFEYVESVFSTTPPVDCRVSSFDLLT